MNRGKLSILKPKTWFLLFALSCLTINGPALADKRVALVIGNSAYVNVPSLANPANDARLMADTLHSLGFTLVGGSAQLDLDEAGFRRAIQIFGVQLRGADVGLLYYAGHGLQVRGQNYLVPVNANPSTEADLDFQMVDASLVLRQMESAGTKLNLVILDACRNNPFGGRGLRSTDSGLAQMRAPEGTLISFATQPGNVALDGSDGNSPYTKALAQAMLKPGLDVFRTFNEVGLAVARATGGAQQPWVSLSPITGDFYFASAPASVTNARPSEDLAAAWAVTQNTTSAAVLEDFIRQFGNTIYGSMARARLQELKNAQVAVVAPLQPKVSPAPVQAALPARTPRPRASTETCASFSGSSGTDVYCASSVLPPEFGNTYGVRNLFSSDDATAWVHGTHKIGTGQWIVVEFDGFRSVKSVTIRNGYQKSADIYSKNSRVRQFRLVFSQGESKVVSLEDRRGEQTILLDRPIRTYWIQFVIEDVFPGWKYPDTAISKLLVASEPIQ